ncbi:Ribonuclease III domain proteins [Phaffia rhodozyma]|uniref:Large ribosomal subunit protein mL44 n=1 Tax=Phaffia rhodozyma TaxID=264483 RepID=A0A0F7SSA4_PHARH|nr:Ribonuclease III domain proteins [Phaffia rhodozyma]
MQPISPRLTSVGRAIATIPTATTAKHFATSLARQSGQIEFTEPLPLSLGTHRKTTLRMLSKPNPAHPELSPDVPVGLPPSVMYERYFDARQFEDSLLPDRTALSTVAARLGLDINHTDTADRILQALTHSSFNQSANVDPNADPSVSSPLASSASPSIDFAASPSNTSLATLGSTILNFTLSEYYSKKFPNISTKGLRLIHAGLTNSLAMEDVAAEIGVGLHRTTGPTSKRVGDWSGSKGVPVRWKRTLKPSETDKDYYLEAITSAVNAMIAVVYEKKGLPAAAAFVNAHFISRSVDIGSFLKFANPKAVLSDIVVKYGLEPPVARLIKETGRMSQTPYFVIAMYSGKIKLGEGWGTSLKMAEHRASTNAIKATYLTETPNPVVSIAGFSPYPLTDEPLASIEQKYAFVAPAIGESESVYSSALRPPRRYRASDHVQPGMEHVVRPKAIEEGKEITQAERLKRLQYQKERQVNWEKAVGDTKDHHRKLEQKLKEVNEMVVRSSRP